VRNNNTQVKPQQLDLYGESVTLTQKRGLWELVVVARINGEYKPTNPPLAYTKREDAESTARFWSKTLHVPIVCIPHDTVGDGERK
jgi:hypothetical protein